MKICQFVDSQCNDPVAKSHPCGHSETPGRQISPPQHQVPSGHGPPGRQQQQQEAGGGSWAANAPWRGYDRAWSEDNETAAAGELEEEEPKNS
uniref:Uncharacterized protein n=1 Tax=Trichogramma kaykai TaxID=54128 RepID=A0ABD2W2Y1_9HYME